MTRTLINCAYHPEEGLVVKIRPPKIDCLPGPVKKHLKASGKEFLLAARELIDTAIKVAEEIEKAKGGEEKVRTKIEVQ